jgi:hypothetical protein
MDNVGRIINDFYCGGFFGREYDLSGAVIVAEGDEWIVIKKENGLFELGTFQEWDWNRNEDGSLAHGISNLRVRKDKQELIDSWC